MKVLVLFCCFVAYAASFPSPQFTAQQQAAGAAPVQVIIPYNYGYSVEDPLTNNFQNKAEMKDINGNVFGSYSVLMPDGYIYTTSYNVTGLSGFVARLVKTLPNVHATAGR